MKKLTGIIWVSLLLVAVTPAGARQLGRNNNAAGDRVCVYQNTYFSGWQECYRPGDEVTDLHTHGNNISSIRVYGNAILSAYDRKNFEGASTQITSEVRDLGQLSSGGFGNRQNWNDRIESFRVTSPNSRTAVPASGRNDRQDDRFGRRDTDSVCVYEDTNYRGRVECFDSGRDIADLGRFGDWSDRISSIRIIGEGRAAAYLDINYRGERLVIDQDVADLSHLHLRNGKGWDNQISSLEVGGGRRAVGRR
jgi:hypothetical protein